MSHRFLTYAFTFPDPRIATVKLNLPFTIRAMPMRTDAHVRKAKGCLGGEKTIFSPSSYRYKHSVRAVGTAIIIRGPSVKSED